MLYLITVSQAGRGYRPLAYTVIFSLSTLCFLISLLCIYKIDLSPKLPLDSFFISSDEQQVSSNDEMYVCFLPWRLICFCFSFAEIFQIPMNQIIRN
jgi:hypothetical protein